MRNFTSELHLHTCYSFLEGASSSRELVARAVELGYRALAITDHDGLHGAMEFAQACVAANLQSIVGVELTLRHGLHDAASGPVHLTLLAENARGYANLCRLITEAHRGTRGWVEVGPGDGGTGREKGMEYSSGAGVSARQADSGPDVGRHGGPPHRSPTRPIALSPSHLIGHTDGLIVLSGCRSGEVARLVDAGKFEAALEAARRLAELFGGRNTFVELQHNLVYGDTRRVARLAELASYLGLEMVATGNVHYHERARHRLQDALVAIKHRTTLEASHRLRRPNSEFFLRSPSEMAERFATYPEAVANTEQIAARCRDFNLADPRALGYDFPDFTRKAGEQHACADEVLAGHCWARFKERYGQVSGVGCRVSESQGTGAWHPTPDTRHLVEQARAQLAEELRLVAKHHLAGFFLIYRDLQELATQVAREVRGAGTVRSGSGLPPGRGRGSSVSSIICYLIGLSHVDPVKNRLFFHRFLNEDLQSVPDIDLDFARDIREQLILRVYERYGHEHAALVCSFATYHLRSAVRDLGKVLGLPAAAIDKLAKLSEGGGADTVRDELSRLPEFQGQAQGPLWRHLVDLAEQLNGFPRHVGQHVGGMIISSRPLVELAPVQPAAMDGRFICQWDKDSCDDARFIKIDFLALGMLSLVEECLELIWQARGEKVDLSVVPYDDPAVYDAICRGDTVGMFQIESRAQIQMLPRTQPRTLDDLAVQVAIVRPGPIVGGAVNPYVRRRERLRRDPTYKPQADHPKLNELLRDTLGVVLYQDQVLEVAITLAGFTPGQADRFRRAMSRRRSREAMEGFRESFVRGALAANTTETPPITEREALAIFDKLCGFSEFGFPKSHAYAFAVLAYQSAWLRYYYPAEYYAALFNNQPMGFYSPHVLVGDARRHGLAVLRVAINRSDVKTTPLVASWQSAAGGRQSVVGGGQRCSHPARPELVEGRVGAGSSPSHPAPCPLPTANRQPPTDPDPGGILIGLTTVQGIGEDLAKAIVAEREANGPYRSLPDLLRRTGLPQQAAERLIAVGALSDFGLGRRELLWQLGLLSKCKVQSAKCKVARSHPTVHFALSTLHFVEHDMVHLPDMDDWERMVADYALLKLSPSYHPLGLMRPHLPSDIHTAAELRKAVDGARERTAGLVVCRQRPGTAKGFVFLLIEDETGLTNVVIRPDLYEAQRSVIRGAPYLWVEGVVQLHSGTLNLLADRVAPLAKVPRPLLPQPALRHAYPGNPHDPREAAAITMEQARPTHSVLTQLQVAPASHDFH